MKIPADESLYLSSAGIIKYVLISGHIFIHYIKTSRKCFISLIDFYVRKV